MGSMSGKEEEGGEEAMLTWATLAWVVHSQEGIRALPACRLWQHG